MKIGAKFSIESRA